MSGSINKVILVGNLGANPEIKILPSGYQVVSLRLATTDDWVDQNTGAKRERTEWHSVSVFSKNAASYADNFLQKGDRVYVEGKLRTRQWEDQNGTRKSSVDIVIGSFSGQLIGLTKRNATHTTPKTTPTVSESEPATWPENANDTIPF